MDAPATSVRLEREGAVLSIVLARSEKRNALNQPMLDAFDRALTDVDRDRSVHVVVVRAEGDHFCAGFDLDTVQADELIEDRVVREREQLFDRGLRLRELDKPTIASVQGACVAAGLLISQTCDLVVAADDAYFHDPLPRMGGVGLELLLQPWDMGVRKAKRYLFTGDRIPAGDALELGMVTDLVARDRLVAETDELAQRIAAMPPVTLSLLKRSLNRTQDLMGMRAALEQHFALHELGHATQESRALLHLARQGRPLKEYFERRDEGTL